LIDLSGKLVLEKLALNIFTTTQYSAFACRRLRVILPSVLGGDRGVTMAYPLPTQISSLISTAAAAFAVAVVLNPIANAQSSDNQQKCSAEAKRTFEELRREYDAEVKGLQLKVDVGSNDYRHYYNSKLKRCLLLINKSTTMVDELSHTSYLIDTDRRMYAVYIETNSQVQSCTLLQSARQTTACKRRDEFDAFVSRYLEK
jgi:hypothetical protein